MRAMTNPSKQRDYCNTGGASPDNKFDSLPILSCSKEGLSYNMTFL